MFLHVWEGDLKSVRPSISSCATCSGPILLNRSVNEWPCRKALKAVIKCKKRIGDGCWVTLTDISGKDQCVVLVNNVLFIMLL